MHWIYTMLCNSLLCRPVFSNMIRVYVSPVMILSISKKQMKKIDRSSTFL